MKYILSFLLAVFFITTAYGNSFENKYATENQAVIFMYHHFGKNKYPSTNIRLEQFRKQLDYLQRNNYNIWPLSKVVRYTKNKMSIPPKTVSLTIDDAYISIYTHAFPMLKRRNFPFSVFVNTNPIGKNSINYMTWNQMREMKRYGAEFANHSSTHDYLKPKRSESRYEWQERIRKELEDAQVTLQKELGYGTNENPKIVSYPFGEYTQETADFIKSLGYIGVSQTSGVLSQSSDLRRIPRYAMNETYSNMESFALKLDTLALGVESAEPWDPLVRTNPPRLRVKLKNTMKHLGCYTSNGKKIQVKWRSEKEFEAQANLPLQGERDRYTCTGQDYQGQWYWYSHLWILSK